MAPARLPKTLLVPTDFSEGSEAALRYAIDLARPLDGTVVLLHAYEVPVAGIPEAAFVAPADLGERLSRASQAALDSLLERYRGTGVPLRGTLRCGDPRDVIDQVLADTTPDLVVMGTHGRRGISRILLGSVAEHVVRTATCPVLTLRVPSKPSA